MEKLINTIMGRKSVRTYDEKPVSEEHLSAGQIWYLTR